MVRTIRIGKRFYDLRQEMKQELTPKYGQISDSMLTDSIADFIRDEHLDRLMINKALRRKRGGGLF